MKFSSVVGEILADLAIDGRSRQNIKPFSLSRFDTQGKPEAGLPLEGDLNEQR